jgi:hypothetical protein
LPDDHFEQQ